MAVVADRLPCPLCERDSISIGALRQHVRYMHHTTLGKVVGTRRPRPLKTHCVNGHEYTPENTYWTPSRTDARLCRICRDAHSKARDKRGRRMRVDENGKLRYTRIYGPDSNAVRR